MKKRVVAFLLSMTLCSAMVVEAGATAAGDFTASVASEDVFSDSETPDQEPTVDVQPGNDPTENGGAGDVPAGGTEGDNDIFGDSEEGPEIPSDETFDDTADGDITDDNTANDGAEVPDGDVPEDETGDGSADVPADTPAGDETDPGVDFSDGLSVPEEEESAPANTVILQLNNAVDPAADFETVDEENHTATLLWTRWKYVNGKWKLQKLPKAPVVTQAPPSAEEVPDADADVSEGEDIASTEIEVPAETPAADAEVSSEPEAEVPAFEADQEAEAEISDMTAKASVEVSFDDVPEEDSSEAALQTVPSNVPVMPEAAVSEVQTPATEYFENEMVTVTSTFSNGQKVETGTYYFDADGNLVTGRTVVKKDTAGLTFDKNTEFYFLEESKAEIERHLGNNPVEITPYNSNFGQMQKNYWLWDGKVFHNYAKDGSAVKIEKQLYKIDGEFYYLSPTGRPYVGVAQAVWNNIKSYYCFEPAANKDDIPGKMGFDRWYSRKTTKGDQWLYFGSSGRFMRKYAGTYKLLSYRGVQTDYLIDHNGYLVRNKAIKAHNGYYYVANGSGIIYKDCLVKTGGYRYYYIKDGRRVVWKNRWIQVPNGKNKPRYYYIGSTAGRIDEKKGIQKVSYGGKFTGWFLFDSNGNNVQDRWESDRYYLPDGRMASGPVTVDGNKYFFELSSTKEYKGKRYKNKWIKYKDQYYYAIKDGRLCGGGWKTIEGGRYYFQNWTAVTRTVMKDPSTGKYGWLDGRGKYQTEWIAYNNSKNSARYLDPKTGRLYQNTIKVIDGKQYRFDKYGDRVIDRTSEFRQKVGSYYLECDRVNGVMTVYTNKSKTIPIKTIRVSVGNPWTPTPLMTNEKMDQAGRWQLLMGPSWGQYGTHVRGGIYIHSVASGLMHGNNLPAGEYLKLGNPASHGCIRCCVADAKWVWDNCDGSRIDIIDGKYKSDECFKGPLGRRPLTPLRGSGTFDPTDPEYN